jgi:hypothetical protein
VSPLATTGYTVEARDPATLAADAAAAVVSVHPPLSPVILQDPEPMCVEVDRVTLQVTPAAVSYLWLEDGTPLGLSEQDIVRTGDACGRTYSVQVTDGNGCVTQTSHVVACTTCTPDEVSAAGSAVPLRVGLDAAGTLEFELLPGGDVTYTLYHSATIEDMLAGEWTHRFCDLAAGVTGTWTPLGPDTVRWTPVVPGLFYEGVWVVVAERQGYESSYGLMSDGEERPADADGVGTEGSWGCP